MKIVIATDSFKGCLSSLEAGNAICRGILKSLPDAYVKVFSVSDGGEGISEALMGHLCTEWVEKEVTGPTFNKVTAGYGINRERKLAVIEMAAAAGLSLVEGKKNPKQATTYGVGELIVDALEKGIYEFIVGIGGSATNDGGLGMLTALGFRFLDKNNNPVSPTPEGMKDIVTIDLRGVSKELKKCHFTVACDVDIPLCGINGCSRMFGPQKGADPKDIADMDEWLSRYAELTKKIIKESDKDFPGAGAAGGMGFALKSFLGAELKPGIELVISGIGLEKEISEADLVITGEGRIDGQTARGKVVFGVSHISKKYQKAVFAFCGRSDVTPDIVGVDGIYPVTPVGMPSSIALKPDVAIENIERTAEQKILNIYTGFSCM